MVVKRRIQKRAGDFLFPFLNLQQVMEYGYVQIHMKVLQEMKAIFAMDHVIDHIYVFLCLHGMYL